MPPFGLFGKKKQKQHSLPTLPEEDSLGGMAPPHEPSGSWRRVLSRKKTHPVPAERHDIVAKDTYYNGPIHAHQTGASYHSNRHTRVTSDDLLDQQHTGSSYRSKAGGPYFAPTIGPADSASNVQSNYPPTGPIITSLSNQPMRGIVEEHSDNMEYRSASPVITPIAGGRPGEPIVVGQVMQQHTGSTHMQMPVPQMYTINGQPVPLGSEYVHEHQQQYYQPVPGKLAPLEIKDGKGVPQQVTEIVLDGTGVQEIPMPADGNVVFIIEDGVTLDVKDPVTGEYVPLEEYYANRARFQQPQRLDQYVVVSGDSSNIIVEDHQGRVLHMGSHVESQSQVDIGSPTGTSSALSVR